MTTANKPGGPFALADDAAHVWTLRWRDLSTSGLADLYAALLPQDRARADRYKIPDDRARFCTGRGFLRRLSARYLDAAPDALALGCGPHGKPFWESAAGRLAFNVSHSGDWVLLAFTAGRALGVDVQQTDRAKDYEKIAAREYHPLEQEALATAASEERKEIFYDIWACKEAVIKAAGESVHGRLDGFSVAPLPATGRWHAVPPGLFPRTLLRLCPVDAVHSAALAVQTDETDLDVCIRTLSDTACLEGNVP